MGFITRSIVVLFALIFVYEVASSCDITTGSFGSGLGLPGTLGFYNLSQINLTVCPFTVPGSVIGYVQLMNGTFDVFTGTLTDNAFSRYYDPASYPGQTIVMLGETSIGNNGVVFGANWNITKFEDLRGKNILVDSPISGFILAFQRVLAFYNLYLERGDYQMIPYGQSRFAPLYAGFIVINGVNYTVSAAALQAPQGVQLLSNASFYAPRVRSLGAFNDYVYPLSGGSIQTRPDRINATTNPVLRNKIIRLMAGLLLANRFEVNPANSAYLYNLIATQLAGQPISYINASYYYTYGAGAGLTNDFQFNTQGLLNTAYIKQDFGGAPYNTTDFGPTLLTTGPGHFIDYSVRDAALAIVNSITTIQVNIAGNGAYQNTCIYPSQQKYYSIQGLVGGLQALSTGGCLGAPKVNLASCYSNSTYFYPAQCVYTASSDTVTLQGGLNSSELVRFYFINYTITEPCGGSNNFTVTYQLYSSSHSAPSNCIDISSQYHN